MFRINKIMRSQLAHVEQQGNEKIIEEQAVRMIEDADNRQRERELAVQKATRLVAKAKRARQKAEQRKSELAQMKRA